ncbi:MAG: hypothetical protein V3V35_08960 [Dehalococcoidia bacterium]
MVKPFELDDPMGLVAVATPGQDPGQFIDEIIQEYLFLGWKPGEIFFLFRMPNYAATHRVYRQMGEAHIKDRIESLAQQWQRGWLRGADTDA